MPPSVAQAAKLLEQGKVEKAAQELRVLAAISPKNVDVHRLAGKCQMLLGRIDEAVKHTAEVVRLAPAQIEGYSNHGALLAMLGRKAEAADVLERARRISPRDVGVLANLAGVLHELHRYAEAEDAARALLEVMPTDAVGLTNLSMTLHVTGRTREALEVLATLERHHPQAAATKEACATFLLYESGIDAKRILEAHVRWARASLPVANWVASARAATDGSRVRLGVISGDLRGHSIAYFVEPLLARLDRAKFDMFVYNTSPHADDTTRRLRAYPAAWRDLFTLKPPAQLAAMRADRLDAVVELSGLTTGNSLRLLSQRVARVQVTYLGYPATTGCGAMDVRLVDANTDPTGSEWMCTERLVRLAPPFVCYAPPKDAPAIEPRPDGRAITFGCFGFIGKYSDLMVELWARVMRAVPEARLVLKSQPFSDMRTAERTLERFVGAGVARERMEIRPPTVSIADHLLSYAAVDVALDTYPYAGTTTTCEAMLMGVPTVTMVGETHASRVGLTLLKAVRLEELAATTGDQFVEIAAGLARDGERLRGLRAELRGRLLGSALCDGPGFAARFGAVIEGLVRGAR